jgi:hypothetical protein
LNTVADIVADRHYLKPINECEQSAPLLPLVHVCDCHALRTIITAQKLSPRLCKVYSESLLYFFYGRPAYRLNNGELPVSMPALFPSCLILDTHLVSGVKRIYPFDTGAFEAGLYSDLMNKNATRDDYIFCTEYSFIQKYIGYMYSSNKNYYDNVPAVTAAVLPPMGFELHALLELITRKAASAVDDRGYTVEVQSTSEVDIASGAVKAIVAPEVIFEDPYLTAFVYDNDIEPITYPGMRASPSALSTVIISKVRDYYVQEGVF